MLTLLCRTPVTAQLLMLALGLAAAAPGAVVAQDAETVSASQLLFEPVAVPAAGTPEPAFITLDAATSSASNSTTGIASLEAALTEQEQVLQSALAASGDNAVATANAYKAFADWNLRVFIDESTIAQSVTRMDSSRFGNMRMTSPQGGNAGDLLAAREGVNQLQTTLRNLFLAKNNYLQALGALLKSGDYGNPELLQLERRFQQTLLLSKHRENIIYDPDFYLTRRSSATGTRLNTSTQELLNAEEYKEGQTSFQRALDYIDKNKARTAEQIATTLLEEADWDLMFARTTDAAAKYDGAYQFFESSPVVKERAKALIDPAAPIVLPAFMPAPNSRERLHIAADKQVPWIGYFDVSFAIQKNGRSEKLRINGRGGNVTDAMEQHLRELIGKSVFRPRYVAGTQSEAVWTLRYYVGY